MAGIAAAFYAIAVLLLALIMSRRYASANAVDITAGIDAAAAALLKAGIVTILKNGKLLPRPG